MKLKKNNLLIFRTFSTNPKKKDYIESTKFISALQKETTNLFLKNYLLGNMAFALIHFCIAQRHLNNIPNYINSLIPINKYLYITENNKYLSWIEFMNYFFRATFINFFLKKKIYKKINNLLKKNFLSMYNNILTKPVNLTQRSKQIFKEKILNKNALISISSAASVRAFLFLRSTRNNFFVTVLDNWGNTLINRTGGSSEWTGTWQRSTVHSADSAIYEACYLAKQWGIETLSVHLLSTFWLPQMKNSFDGIETADLPIDELIYWPKLSIGGCWKKKPRWV